MRCDNIVVIFEAQGIFNGNQWVLHNDTSIQTVDRSRFVLWMNVDVYHWVEFVRNRSAETIMPLIQAHVALGFSISTETWLAYNRIDKLNVIPPVRSRNCCTRNQLQYRHSHANRWGVLKPPKKETQAQERSKQQRSTHGAYTQENVAAITSSYATILAF